MHLYLYKAEADRVDADQRRGRRDEPLRPVAPHLEGNKGEGGRGERAGLRAGTLALVGRPQGCGLRNGRVSIHSLGSPRGAQPRAERPHGAHADAGWVVCVGGFLTLGGG